MKQLWSETIISLLAVDFASSFPFLVGIVAAVDLGVILPFALVNKLISSLSTSSLTLNSRILHAHLLTWRDWGFCLVTLHRPRTKPVLINTGIAVAETWAQSVSPVAIIFAFVWWTEKGSLRETEAFVKVTWLWIVDCEWWSQQSVSEFGRTQKVPGSSVLPYCSSATHFALDPSVCGFPIMPSYVWLHVFALAIMRVSACVCSGHHVCECMCLLWPWCVWVHAFALANMCVSACVCSGYSVCKCMYLLWPLLLQRRVRIFAKQTGCRILLFFNDFWVFYSYLACPHLFLSAVSYLHNLLL